jgi:hypothetical protein
MMQTSRMSFKENHSWTYLYGRSANGVEVFSINFKPSFHYKFIKKEKG